MGFSPTKSHGDGKLKRSISFVSARGKGDPRDFLMLDPEYLIIMINSILDVAV
jgi:hypothetical protein